MAKNYNYIMEDWLAECKERYSNDTMEKALSEGRVGVRTFDKESINEDLTKAKLESKV